MKREWIIDACSGKCIDVTEGQRITVVDLEGGQVVDFFAVSAKDTSEFLSTGVTIDCNESLRLHVGDLVYSNLYRPMFQILSDDVGEHDLLHPCCRKEMYDFFYQKETFLQDQMFRDHVRRVSVGVRLQFLGDDFRNVGFFRQGFRFHADERNDRNL